MSAKKRGKSWRDRLREKQIRYQRLLEFHRKRLERILNEKAKKAHRRKLLLIFGSFIALLLAIYGATYYLTTPPSIPETSGQIQESVQAPINQFDVEAILILPDGSIYPSAAPIKRISDNYYIIDADITMPLKIGRDNILIDGAGHTLRGNGIFGSRGIDISSRKNVTIKNIKIEAFDYGVYLNFTSGCVIAENEFTNNYCAVWITRSSNNKIESNIIANISLSQGYGVWVKNSTGNLIVKNNITRYSYGIYLGGSDSNTIHQNLFKGNRVGIYVYFSANNTISSNRFTDNHDGIHMLKSQSNIIIMNTFSKNDVGLGLDNSSGNVVYHNNFIDNSNQVYVNNSTNIWDGGQLIGGNYWSDYNGQDEDGDGIGDIPYIIDENNKDNYPFMVEKV